MFSIEPNLHFINESLNHVRGADVTGSSKLLVPGRATAVTKIAEGTKTNPIDPKRLTGHCDVVQILIGTNPNGSMELDESSTQVWSKNTHWIRALRLSDDCHSCNIQLKLLPSSSKKLNTSKIVLEAIRPIAIGQELLLWFSDDLLAMMQMVFLTPANIQGQKKYVCTRCSILYESPNPLKLHILLSCGRQTMTDFWNKLSGLLIEHCRCKSTRQQSSIGFNFELTNLENNSVRKQRNAIDLSTSRIPTSNSYLDVNQTPTAPSSSNLYRPYSENPTARGCSAFKPFQKIAIEENNAAKPTAFNIQNPPMFYPGLEFNESLYNQNKLQNSNQYNDEAHIETLVSSLGKSKEGHVCLYCGKCYSRKYGLKIHIRTHTGYKPLKCKFCLRPFGDPSNLNKHVRLHAEGETPYKCDICGKILVRRRDLERHLKSRHMADIHPGRSIIVENNSIREPDTTEGDLVTD